MLANPAQNYFELFRLPVGFDVDAEALSLNYRELQRAVHPDRFANASDQERRLAVQQAALVNEAYRTLRSPLARARYLLELRGRPLDDRDTAMDPTFLMEQLELREDLEAVRGAADPFAALETVRARVEARDRELIDELRAMLDHGGEAGLDTARELVRKMQFMHRLLDETAELEEELAHSH